MMVQNSKILVSNCRGAVNTGFYRSCKHYMDDNKPKVLVIMKTIVDPSKLKNIFNWLDSTRMYIQNVEVMLGENGSIEI